jgi:integral membrane protein
MTDLAKLRCLRRVGIAEGISFIVLLAVAMPLKYFWGWPLAVKVVGWAHGVLFVAYLAAVVLAARVMDYNLGRLMVAFAASLIPIGTFWLDREWRTREQELLKTKTATG